MKVSSVYVVVSVFKEIKIFFLPISLAFARSRVVFVVKETRKLPCNRKSRISYKKNALESNVLICVAEGEGCLKEFKYNYEKT